MTVDKILTVTRGSYGSFLFIFNSAIGRRERRHKPELLSEVGSEVLCQLVVVLQAGQQEATALEQQDRLNRTQKGLLRV